MSLVVWYNNPMDAYMTISGEGHGEFVVSRSRFIGWAKPAAREEDALAFIEDIRKAHGDASHNAWAYALDGARERCSDDGEPRGTAGVPILEVIHREGLQDTVVVVTRYFGGVKLGAGGLLRAYGKGAKIAIDAAGVIERRPYLSFSITASYADGERLQRECGACGYRITHIDYQDKMTLTVLVTPEERDALFALTAACTSGSGAIQAGSDVYIDF